MEYVLGCGRSEASKTIPQWKNKGLTSRMQTKKRKGLYACVRASAHMLLRMIACFCLFEGWGVGDLLG